MTDGYITKNTCYHFSMDHEQGSLRGSIPRLSRLPMPRASHDNLKLAKGPTSPSIHTDEPTKSSFLPRPTANTSRVLSQSPLSEAPNGSIRSRFRWFDSSSRNATIRSPSPVRDAIVVSHIATLDTTPPGGSPEALNVYHEGNENATAIDSKSIDAEPVREKRRPRPSLSERTMETLLMMSPPPSPTRRNRSSTVDSNGAMGPPARPASSVRASRPTTPSLSRSTSPTKTHFRPPGRISPTKDVPTLAAVPSPGSILAPPKAFMRDKSSRIAKPLRETRRSVSTVWGPAVEPAAGQQKPTVKKGSQTMRVRPTQPKGHDCSTKSKPSLSSLFNEPTTTVNASGPPAVSGLLKPRTWGENTIAPSLTPPKANSPKPKGAMSSRSKNPVRKEPVLDENSGKPLKSSAALRETIAKAKAAKMIASGTFRGTEQVPAASSSWPNIEIDDLPGLSVDNKGLLKKRIDCGVTTGQLNISAMNLKEFPEQIKTVYSFDGSQSWAEAVDLTKLNVASNEFEELSDEHFPDWTAEEMMDDEEKTNQFGGLESLDLHDNILKSLPTGIRRLDRLTVLNLNNNKLDMQVLDVVCQLKNLKELYIANNSLSGSLSEQLGKLASLRVLDVSGNEITELPSSVSRLTNLHTLKVSGNKLMSLPAKALSELPIIEIHASKNKLSGILFGDGVNGYSKLRALNIASNSISALSTSSFVLASLQDLNVSQNRLNSLSISQCTSLIILTASQNQLTDFPTELERLSELTSLDLSQNIIKAVPSEITKLEKLNVINLMGNPLAVRKYLTMNAEDLKADFKKKTAIAESCETAPSTSSMHKRSTSRMTNTTTTNTTTATQSSEEPTTSAAPAEDEPQLYKPVNGVLDLSSLLLTSISPSQVDLPTSTAPAHTQIHTLLLTNNALPTLPHDLLSHPALKYHLRTLDISHNPSLHPTGYLTAPLFLPHLTSLSLVSTGLTSLDNLTTNLNAPELASLNISCHRMSGHVPWVRAWYPKLTELLATDNWFTSIDVEAVRGLEVLDVRNNEIESLPPRLGLLGSTLR